MYAYNFSEKIVLYRTRGEFKTMRSLSLKAEYISNVNHMF